MNKDLSVYLSSKEWQVVFGSQSIPCWSFTFLWKQIEFFIMNVSREMFIAEAGVLHKLS